MTTLLYIATAMGLYIAAHVNGQWQVVYHALDNQSLTSVDISGKIILVGTREGLWRSADNGRTWRPAGDKRSVGHVRWIKTVTAGEPHFLVGTEPAGIFLSRDGGFKWTLSTDVTRLRNRYNWFLPYSPEAGCVRGFAVAHAGGAAARIYAAVEVGGVLFSQDHGLSWQLADGSDGRPDIQPNLGTMIHPDVHSITVHPKDQSVVTAPTGGGLFRSMDGGKTWNNIYRCYMRAVWVDPEDHRHMVAGPADGVSRNGRIESTTDGGITWLPSDKGLQMPWPRHMVERFAHTEEELLAILSNGEIWAGKRHQLSWYRVLPEISEVNAVAVNPG